MDVRFWGTRGSYPASGAAFSEFGHHTICVSLRGDDTLIVFDAGSGATALGEYLRAQPVRHVYLLISHFHHDHLVGLPFLLHGACAARETKVALHCALPIENTLEELIRPMISAPYFPDEAGDLAGRISYNRHAPGESFVLGGAVAHSALVEHPGGAVAYRVEQDGAAIVFVTDIEDTISPPRHLVTLAEGADLLMHDTMFTGEEILTRRGWGHGTIEGALSLARAADVRQLAGFHHNPLHDDALLRAREQALQSVFPTSCLAREGQIIQVTKAASERVHDLRASARS